MIDFCKLRIRKMWKPCEKASDFIRRQEKRDPFEFRTLNQSVEKINFGEIIEIQAPSIEIPTMVLDTVCQFCHQFDDGVPHL